MTISFSGLASGIDTDSIVSQLVAASRTPITKLTSQKAVLESKQKKITSLASKLGDLATAAKALGTPEKASPTSASSSDESVLRVRGTGIASPGRFGVRVVSMANADRFYGGPLASRDVAGVAGSGTLSIAVGSGAPAAISISATDTLDAIAARITAAGAGVTASVLSTETGFRLQIAGIQTGAANALTISEAGTTLGFGGTDGHPVVASDARVEIDGFAVTSSTNTVSGAVPGVTLELRGTSPTGTTQSIDVSRDATAVTERVRTLVGAWNVTMGQINAESSMVAGVTKSADSLSGDIALRTVQTRLRSIATAPVAGATGRYTTLGSIGVSIQRDGTFLLDETKLSSAMAADPDAVARVLGSDSGAMSQIDDAVTAWKTPSNGLFDARQTATRNQTKRIDQQVERLQTRLDAYESHLRAKFTALEQVMSGLQGQSAQLAAALGS